MARRQRSTAESWLFSIFLAVVVLTLIFARLRPLLRGPRSIPKVVQADGALYLACGGAIWVANEGNEANRGERTYYVMFKDADGTTHELKKVRTLNVSDLPSDSAACKPH